MSEHREHGLDVRLMRILLLLLTECSVSRTAVVLGQSQPAVSLALKRLRDILGDPLLVRSGARLVPTDRGLEVAERVRKVLAEIDGLVEPEAAFVPVEAHQRVDGLRTGGEDIDQALVRPHLEVLHRFLIDGGRALDGEDALLGREQNGTGDSRAGAAGGIYDLFRRLI